MAEFPPPTTVSAVPPSKPKRNWKKISIITAAVVVGLAVVGAAVSDDEPESSNEQEVEAVTTDAPEPTAPPVTQAPAPAPPPPPAGNADVTGRAWAQEQRDLCDEMAAASNNHDGSIILSPFGTDNFDEWCDGLFYMADIINESSDASALCEEFFLGDDQDIIDLLRYDFGFTQDEAVGALDMLYVYCFDQ